MSICFFELHATGAMTMFYKNLFRVVATDNGTLHHYEDSSRTFSMSEIITADGYPKLVYVFNDSLPGPVLHVYQNQIVRIRIYNDFPTESLSVHFHGIRQVNTPESDGVGRVTQLSILPGSSFQHEFVALDTGTFWYHSHSQSQIAMGLLGGFVVHPQEVTNREEHGEFVMVLTDWQHFYTSEQHHLLIESGQFYPNSLESLKTSGTIDFYEAVDGSRAAEAIVTSILINGRGQYFDPRAENDRSSTTPLEYLRVVSAPNNAVYRIRLINGGSVFPLKFSIDDHPLKVIASDGIPLAEPMIVDQVTVGLGERYDVLVTATKKRAINYWIRVDTMDKNNNPRWHARAILQYTTDTIMPTSKPRKCTSSKPCVILNCPFTQYGPNTENSAMPMICLTPLNLTTRADHIDHDLLDETIIPEVRKTLQLTIVKGTNKRAGFESFNYIGMKYPSIDKPILYNARRIRKNFQCSNRLLDDDTGEKCYHTIMAQYNDIVELLLVNHDDDQHPLHLHGSYFHIVELGLAQLNLTTGRIKANNPNVYCNQHAQCSCTKANGACKKNNIRLVKDTLQLPKGGYVNTVYLSFTHGIPSEAEHLFDLPDQWPSYCGNANTGKVQFSAIYQHLHVMLFLGFNIEPMHGFVVTPDGQDHFKLQLQTPPVHALGDQVRVEFKVKPNWYYNGTRCAEFNTIVFDRKNWQKPQQVDMSFVDYGCCTYAITANGGGYDWQYAVSTFVVYACDGQAGYGCKGKEPCGA
ncbi:unnamed protein product [Rotaria sp. Silwood2]|nr:unnamed protein product [Rotaria sp. Silwood2]